VNWDLALDAMAGACLLVGCAFTLIAGVGVLRFGDLLTRIHAGAKPQVLGVLLALIGLGLRLRSPGLITTLILVGLFQLLTAPVAAHLVARAGYRARKIDPESLVVDELTEHLREAGEDSEQSVD
jgi:multicomponent Na+:H+ antiporter subunit G